MLLIAAQEVLEPGDGDGPDERGEPMRCCRRPFPNLPIRFAFLPATPPPVLAGACERSRPLKYNSIGRWKGATRKTSIRWKGKPSRQQCGYLSPHAS